MNNRLSEGDVEITDMPPMNIVKCRCSESCPFSDACDKDATEGEGLLCDPCREALQNIKRAREGVYSLGILDTIRFLSKVRSLSHCHTCDKPFTDEEGDTSAS